MYRVYGAVVYSYISVPKSVTAAHYYSLRKYDPAKTLYIYIYSVYRIPGYMCVPDGRRLGGSLTKNKYILIIIKIIIITGNNR